MRMNSLYLSLKRWIDLKIIFLFNECVVFGLDPETHVKEH